MKRSIEAQEELFEGALPIHRAVVFLVHRPDLDQLDEACRYLKSCFRRPAWVERQQDYAWKVWLQTLPVVWEALMTSPFKRRQLYLTGEVPGLMPLVLTQPCDARGFELIAEEGGSSTCSELVKFATRLQKLIEQSRRDPKICFPL